jgi:hypothetical protein
VKREAWQAGERPEKKEASQKGSSDGKSNVPSIQSAGERPTPPPQRHPLPLRVFFLLVCIGLVTSTGSGIYMAYKYSRGPRLVTGLLLVGLILPVLLTFV